MKKTMYLLLTAIFLAFAYLQLNDPDPIHWTLGYLAVAVSCSMAAFGKYPAWWLAAVTAIFGAWMLIASPGIIHWVQQGFPDIAGEMKASTPVIEDSREFLGLLIAFLVMLGMAIDGKRQRRRSVG
ncbi:MAG: transmembrane 220 family protein [Flavobacteriales bacterium]|nr:transmembrane 220 family protein [Flavobacteriales bacterium]